MQYKTVARARFLKRLNRFVATVELEGKEETVHVKNTGRCRELLLPDARVVLSRGDGAARKTAWDLVAVWKEREEGKVLLNMDAQAPNAAVAEWLPKSRLFSPEVWKISMNWPNWLAIRIFLPRPNTNRRRPSRKSSMVVWRLFSSRSTSTYRTMGPAMSWGKSTT
jgi:hypothetical protein